MKNSPPLRRSAPRRQYHSNRCLKEESGLSPVFCQLQKEAGRQWSVNPQSPCHISLIKCYTLQSHSWPHPFPSPPQLSPHHSELWWNAELFLPLACRGFKGDAKKKGASKEILDFYLALPASWVPSSQGHYLHIAKLHQCMTKPLTPCCSIGWWRPASWGPMQAVSCAGRADTGEVCPLGALRAQPQFHQHVCQLQQTGVEAICSDKELFRTGTDMILLSCTIPKPVPGAPRMDFTIVC